MPVASYVDWNHVQLLYSQGVTHADIAREIGCSPARISQHVMRHRWKQKLSAARQGVMNVMERVIRTEQMTLAARATAWVEKEASNVELVQSKFDKVPIPSDLGGLKDYEESRGQHAKRGRQTFNLDKDQGAKVVVNVGLSMGSMLPEKPAHVEPDNGLLNRSETP